MNNKTIFGNLWGETLDKSDSPITFIYFRDRYNPSLILDSKLKVKSLIEFLQKELKHYEVLE